jgi:hypothetical protein
MSAGLCDHPADSPIIMLYNLIIEFLRRNLQKINDCGVAVFFIGMFFVGSKTPLFHTLGVIWFFIGCAMILISGFWLRLQNIDDEDGKSIDENPIGPMLWQGSDGDGEWIDVSSEDDAITYRYRRQIQILQRGETTYDPNFGDDRECECGHTYYRHFDGYENNRPGCKYCDCYVFNAKVS